MYVCLCMYMYVCMFVYVCMYVGDSAADHAEDGEVVDLIKSLTYLKPSRRGCPSHLLEHVKLFQYGSLLEEQTSKAIVVTTIIYSNIHTSYKCEHMCIYDCIL